MLDPTSVAVTGAFESPVSGLVVQMQRESSKIACLMAKTTNATAKILAEINQEMGELRMTSYKIELPQTFYCSNIILDVNNSMECIILMCHISSTPFDNQINDLCRERKSPRNKLISPPNLDGSLSSSVPW